MSLQEKVMHELKSVALTTFYFAVWLGVLVLLKRLILAEYQIEFRGLSMAVVGALIIAKVVLVMEHVSLGTWVRRHPLALDVLLRTILYTCGVLIVLLIEKAFETRHDHGGFGASLIQVFHHRDMPHVWANTICIAGGLIWFNVMSAMRKQFGEHSLKRLFFGSPPKKSDKIPSE